MSKLLSPVSLRGLTLRNRTVKIEGVGVISAAPARPARDAGV